MSLPGSKLEALVTARKFLEDNHWLRHVALAMCRDGRYGYCARGAVKYGPFNGEFLGGEGAELFEEVIEALDAAASQKVGEFLYIEKYNDCHALCKEDVLEVFDYAIRRERSAA